MKLKRLSKGNNILPHLKKIFRQDFVAMGWLRILSEDNDETKDDNKFNWEAGFIPSSAQVYLDL